MKKENYDFVAIGDTTTDAFIQLNTDDTEVSVNPETGREKISMNFGDKIEYEDLTLVPAVGNSPNASVSAARLGLSSALISNVGGDTFGKEDIETLKANGVHSDFVKMHDDKKSNYHFVLRLGAERTILVKHEEYPYEMPDIGKPSWLYLSSLGENSLPFHHEIAKYLSENPEVKLAFQPGTFQMKLGYEQLKDIYQVSELFFCNVQEAQRILNTKESDIKKLLDRMRSLGPNIVVITDGPDGAYTYDGNEMWHMPMYPDPVPPVDRTGAGDSFSSTFTSALALGKSIPEALAMGPINSMSVVQHIGAQKGLLSLEKLEEHLATAPDDYKAVQI